MDNLNEEGIMMMDEVIEHYKGRLGTLRSGRANSSMLHGITIDYYGTETPLEQMGSISVSEGRQLVVKLFDPSALKDAERAINDSHLKLPVQNDGQLLRINVPQLTEETRRDVSKDVSVFAEEAKVGIRNVRRDLNDSVKKMENLPEDQEKGMLEDVQELTDSYIKKIDQIAKDKTAEIMTI